MKQNFWVLCPILICSILMASSHVAFYWTYKYGNETIITFTHTQQNNVMDYSARFFVCNLYVICSDVKYDIAVIHILKKLESHCWKK